MIRTAYIFFVILFFISLSQFSVAEDNYDFRKATWGMKKEQVIASDNSKPLHVGPTNTFDIALYEGSVAGLKTEYGYTFVDDILVIGGYTFKEKHSNKNKHIDDFRKLKEILERKYGKHVKFDSVWSNDLYRNNTENYGLAISIGHLALSTKWETDRTIILLILNGDNYDLNLNLFYTSKAHLDLINKTSNKSDEEGL